MADRLKYDKITLEPYTIAKPNYTPLVLKPMQLMQLGLRPGRQSKKVPSLVTKLEAAFHNGYTDSEACGYAGISRQTYYRWLAEDAAFSDTIAAAKLHIIMKARAVIVDAIENGNLRASMFYLERKLPEEFGLRATQPATTSPSFKLTALQMEHVRKANIEGRRILLASQQDGQTVTISD